MIRGFQRRLAKRRRVSTAIGTLVCVAILLGMSFGLEGRGSRPPLSVSVLSVRQTPGSLVVTLRLTASSGTIGVHLALLPGRSLSSVTEAYVFSDPAFFLRFGTASDLVGLEVRISDYLAALSPAIPVAFVDAQALPSVLEANPHSALIDFAYDTLPESLLAENSSLLKTWIEGGGTLIWAGGPLAYFEGNILPNGTLHHEDLGWAGQVALTGFSLEDPIGNPASRSYGPLVGTVETPLASAFGMTYPGTPDGANLSQLLLHNGTDLGFDASPVGSASARTSAAYIPVGEGRIVYFGGGIWGDQVGVIPDADGLLSSDIELLLGSGYAPDSGPTFATEITVNSLRADTVTLMVPSSNGPYVAIASSSVGTATLFFWSTQLV